MDLLLELLNLILLLKCLILLKCLVLLIELLLLLLLLHAPHAHLVVYHVVFHGATSHMENHVGKLDNLNHDRNHVVIHVVFYNPNQTS